MPTGIYLPPWLQPVDQVGPFMQGVSQGVNMARTALAAQAQQFEAQQAQQQLALRQQQEERAIGEAVSRVVAEREQQKRQQQLVDMKAQAAASQFMAQKEYEESIAGGEAPERALMRLAPRLGINPSALASTILRRPQQAQPSTVVEMGGEKFIRQADEFGREKFTPIRPTIQSASKKTLEQQAREKNLDLEIRAKDSEIKAAAANSYGPDDKQAQAAIEKLESQKQELMRQREELYRMPETVSAPNRFGEGKELDEVLARSFLRQAGGDKAKARQMAKDAGYIF